MPYICPLCNGLNSLTSTCPDCGSTLENAGRRQDYAGPYSPYGSADQYHATAFPEELQDCEHIVACDNCKKAYIYYVQAWSVP